MLSAQPANVQPREKDSPILDGSVKNRLLADRQRFNLAAALAGKSRVVKDKAGKPPHAVRPFKAEDLAARLQQLQVAVDRGKADLRELPFNRLKHVFGRAKLAAGFNRPQNQHPLGCVPKTLNS